MFPWSPYNQQTTAITTAKHLTPQTLVGQLGTAGAAGEFSSLGSTFCADSYFSIRSIPVIPQ